MGFSSCKTSPADIATKWTHDIKQKIITDANLRPDSSELDTAYHYLTLYKGGIKLKHFVLQPNFDTLEKIVSFDTVACTLYSSDQKFQIIRELCPAAGRTLEGVNLKGIGFLGLTESRYCNGSLKETRFEYNNKEVGLWTKYDSTGKIIEQKDMGHTDLLNKLQDVKYYR